jgi:hypothetical protein
MLFLLPLYDAYGNMFSNRMPGHEQSGQKKTIRHPESYREADGSFYKYKSKKQDGLLHNQLLRLIGL